jgi:hypothetical protein
MPRTQLTLRLLAVLAIALTTTVLGQSPASAAKGHKPDKVGDAPSIIDIAGFTVRNDAHRVVMTAEVPGLRSRGGFAFEYSSTRFGGLYVFARQNGGGPSVEARYCGEVRCHEVRCAGLDARWSTDRHLVQAIIPQRCYPDALPGPGVFSLTSGSKSAYDDAGVLRVARG